MQQSTSADVKAVGTLAQASTDNVVENCLIDGMGYTGMAVSISGVAALTVATGYLIDGGPGYALRDPFVLDLSSVVASVTDATKTAVVFVVIDGDEATIQETRTFLDPSKKPTNPADPWPTITYATGTRVIRTVDVDKVAGAAAVQPQDPVYPAQLCAIARVVVGNTGIQSVSQITANQITRLDQLVAIVTGLVASTAGYGGAIQGLLSTVAALQKTDTDRFAALTSEIGALQSALTVLGNKVAGIGAGGTATNNYYTYTETYADASGLTAQPSPTYSVGGGLGFPSATSTPGAFSPVNLYAGNIAYLGNRYILPAYTEVVSSERVPVNSGAGVNVGGDPLTGIAFNQMGAFAVPVQMRGFGVERTRYGAPFVAQPAANLLANADPSVLFALHPGDIAYDASWDPWTKNSPELSHQNGYVHDLTSRGYWTTRSPGNAISGLAGIQQFVAPSADQMMTEFDLSVVKGTFGDIRMLVCDLQAAAGADFTRVVADVTCPFASIDPSADIAGLYGVAAFKMPYPILEKLGKRYAYVFVTNGDHKFRTIGNVNYNPALGGGILIGNSLQSLSTYGIEVGHRKKIASFSSASTDVPLNPLYNGGGTDTVDIITPGIVPTGCDIAYKLRNTDGTLSALGSITTAAPNLLAGRPSTVTLTATLTGTGNTAPIIDLGTSVSGTAGGSTAKQAAAIGPVESRVYGIKDASGNAINFAHATRVVTLIGFDPTIHTYSPEQLEVAPGYAAGQALAPTTTSALSKQSDGTYTITFAWTLGTAVAGVKFLMSGSTQDSTRGFKSTVTTTLTT